MSDTHAREAVAGVDSDGSSERSIRSPHPNRSTATEHGPTADGVGPVPPAPAVAVSADELTAGLQPVVLAVPGVASLVPTMTTALGRLRLHRGRPVTRSSTARTEYPEPTTTRSRAAHTVSGASGRVSGGVSGRVGDGGPAATGEGIAVTVKDGAVTVVIDITVTSTTSVLATAVAVRSAAAHAVQAAHHGQFTINVNVLDRDAVADSSTPAISPTSSTSTARSSTAESSAAGSSAAVGIAGSP